ncbi:S8 family peptidase [Paractinoplanes atraurantiacus]|uniref:Serine protease, subtilisin family n=1 Tax=Paractinoplanes atraurantiacus TaxID=1036182 RepID=A0A285J5Y0_9ACTN|nr:S8 family serine peptidase [Actinoplanes atraurantiacus]SNY55622.1 Serine protease, subtilisin family [Actinoplanes atraurantiacus]
MRLVRITSVLALAGVAAWSALPAGGFAAAQTPGPQAVTTATGPAFAASPRAVTLITGDTVKVRGVAGQTTVDVVPAPGREKIPFLTSSAGKDVEVVPADAAGLLAAGRLDPRLFDVSTLLGFGYDDTRRTLPLIVRGTVTPAGARATQQLPDVGLVAYEQDRSRPAELWKSLTSAGKLRSGVTKVWLDGRRKPTLDVSVPLIGAPAAWQAGLTGAGVKVAVIDSGVDLTHPDFAGQVAGAVDFTGSGDLTDPVGHGTHVASTILGTGAASGGRFKGVAPGAKLLSAKVCGLQECYESDILAGMQWAAEQGAAVANMSLGGADTPDLDVLEQGVNDLTAKYGMLFVIAAGNSGEGGDSTVESPGSAEQALTVGAVTKTKELASFSSRGPRAEDAMVKPEITGPGVNIVAARSADGQFPPVDGAEPYTSLSGTSMATPHVAGAAALLAQQHPEWRAARLKATLTAAADPGADLTPYEQGSGLVDVKRAIAQPVTSDPVSIGFQRDGTTQKQLIVYANSGTQPLTLDLSLGTNAPAGVFTVSADRVTVPAGGTASVTVTATVVNGLEEQPYGGELTATAAGVRVVTPVAMYLTRHVLTVNTPGVAGENPRWVTMLTDLDRQTVTAFAHAGASVRTPVEPGRYVVQSYLLTGSEEDPVITSLADPQVMLDRDRTITMDARTAKPVTISVPDKKAAPAYNETGWTLREKAPEIWGSNDPYGVLMNLNFERLRTGPAVGGGKAPGYVSYLSGKWSAPDAVYHAYFYERGRMMAGKTKALRAGDLATVRSTIGADVDGVPVTRLAIARAPGNSAVYRSADGRQSPLAFAYDAPATITEYYNRDQQAEWQVSSSQLGYTHYESAWTSWQPGRAYQEKWANGVEGPVFPEPEFAQQFAARYFGDTMGGPGPLHGDGSGHEGFRFPRAGSADVTIHRDGTLVGQSQWTPQATEVPAAAGDYRVHAVFRSDPAFTLSTLVDAEWTFRSSHVPDGKLVHLPMTAIRYTPSLDASNTVAAGRPTILPVSLDRQIGAAPAAVRTLTVEASFDDGKTWRHVPALRIGTKATAVIQNPRGTGFVSLRSTTTDTAGNGTKQTIIRAYRYR